MKLDLFYEFCQGATDIWQVGADRTLYDEVLEQAEVADEAGFNCFWSVEHHGTVEVTHMPSPEIFLAAVAMRTRRLRIGHSVRLTPYAINHPIRLAEGAAVLDNLSHGRLEMGFGRSVPREWVNFQIPADETPAMLQETLKIVPRLWTEEHVTYKSETLTIPRFTLVPRVLQQPHPPMWIAASNPDSFRLAGRLGIGAMGLVLSRPISFLAERIGIYREAIKDPEPVGKLINNQTGAFTFVYCAETEQEAIDDGAPAAAAWYISKVAAHYSSVPRRTGEGGLDFESTFLYSPEARIAALRSLGDTPATRVMIKLAEQQSVTNEEFYEAMTPEDQVIIGSVDQVLAKIKRYQAAGLDHLMCMVQGGPSLPHEKILKSLRLMGEHVIPHFHQPAADGEDETVAPARTGSAGAGLAAGRQA